jgi:hypothetical protein
MLENLLKTLDRGISGCYRYNKMVDRYKQALVQFAKNVFRVKLEVNGKNFEKLNLMRS